LGYNLIGTGNSLAKFTAGAGDQKNVLNPMLGALADNGGPTRTHALLTGSPAIDAGSPSAVAGQGGVPAGDQRGAAFTRVFNGDNAGTARIDVGAFEFQTPGFSADFNGDDFVDGSDFLAWQLNLGKPNATKPQGDSDNDKDVDAADLAAWEGGFGAGAEDANAVAAATASSEGGSVAAAEAANYAQAEAAGEHDAPAAISPALVVASEPTASDPAPLVRAAGVTGLGALAARSADARFDGNASLRRSDRLIRAAIVELARHAPRTAATAVADIGLLASLPDGGGRECDASSLDEVIFADWDAEFRI
jgi:hypothetical protein